MTPDRNLLFMGLFQHQILIIIYNKLGDKLDQGKIKKKETWNNEEEMGKKESHSTHHLHPNSTERISKGPLHSGILGAHLPPPSFGRSQCLTPKTSKLTIWATFVKEYFYGGIPPNPPPYIEMKLSHYTPSSPPPNSHI